MEECRLAFEKFKKFLISLPLLSKPEVGEELFLYLVATTKAVSSMLIQMDDKKVQKLIYCTSKVLHDMEIKYSKSKKIIFILIIFS